MMTLELKEFLQVLTWSTETVEQARFLIDKFVNSLPHKEGLPSKEEMLLYAMEYNDLV